MKEKNDNYDYSLGITMEEENMLISLKDNMGNEKTDFYNPQKNFDSIIIPFNFENHNYSIRDNELEGYENKEFVLNTLYNYNNQKIFKLDSDYSPSFCERILIFIPMIIFILIIIFIFLSIISLFILNPLIVYISFICLKKIFSFIIGMKNTIYEKLKKKAIYKRLDETNRSQYCKLHNIEWKLGLSGYWLEIKKIQKLHCELEDRKTN